MFWSAVKKNSKYTHIIWAICHEIENHKLENQWCSKNGTFTNSRIHDFFFVRIGDGSLFWTVYIFDKLFWREVCRDSKFEILSKMACRLHFWCLKDGHKLENAGQRLNFKCYLLLPQLSDKTIFCLIMVCSQKHDILNVFWFSSKSVSRLIQLCWFKKSNLYRSKTPHSRALDQNLTSIFQQKKHFSRKFQDQKPFV